MICPYCGKPAEFVTGESVYPHRKDLYHKAFYLCRPCWAYVGCHKGTGNPLGRLANAELRQWKMRAHSAFDPIWKSKKMRRGEAYVWLARELGMSRAECHIGMMDVETCKQVVEVCNAHTA